MPKRYISYDIKAENDYARLYALLEEWGAKKVTESTYVVQVDVKLDEFCNMIEKATAKGDSVVVIFKTDTGLTHKKIR